MLSTNSNFADVVNYVIGIINLTIPVLVALAVVMFMWGAVRFIMKSGESVGGAAERDAMVWGVIALFVLFSIWGILHIMQNTLLGAGSYSGSSAGSSGNCVTTSHTITNSSNGVIGAVKTTDCSK
ncbi:MAG TPA: hypothetical protein VG753_02290 [Candidatus Paceibacterota bacterium]|nr:hypothetical protein [Candidatus Paceibacterota bacterium]